MLWSFQWLHRVGPCNKVSRRPDWFWWSPPRILIYIPVLHDQVSIWLYSATWNYIIELSVASGTWLGEKPHWCFAKVPTRTHCISGECWTDVSSSLSRPLLLSPIKISLVAIRRLFWGPCWPLNVNDLIWGTLSPSYTSFALKKTNDHTAKWRTRMTEAGGADSRLVM